MEIIARPERIEATAIKCDRYDGEVWGIAAVKFTLQDPNTPEDEPCRHGHEVFVPLGGRLREVLIDYSQVDIDRRRTHQLKTK